MVCAGLVDLDIFCVELNMACLTVSLMLSTSIIWYNDMDKSFWHLQNSIIRQINFECACPGSGFQPGSGIKLGTIRISNFQLETEDQRSRELVTTEFRNLHTEQTGIRIDITYPHLLLIPHNYFRPN